MGISVIRDRHNIFSVKCDLQFIIFLENKKCHNNIDGMNLHTDWAIEW